MALVDASNFLFQTAVQFVNQTSRHIFLTGKAGTGKTTFLKYIRENSFKRIAVVAPTGVAAINAGGVTMHSFFQLPFGPYVPTRRTEWGSEITNEHMLFKNLRFNNEKKELLRELDLLIIDEVSMVRADMLDATDTILRRFRQQPLLPFGGVQVLYIGDLFQLPPVINNAEWDILKEYYPSPFFFDSLAVQQAPPILIELKKIYRQNEEEFITILNNIRDKKATDEDLKKLHEHYQPHFRTEDKEHFITLTTHNNKAADINQNKLRKLPGRLFEFKAELTGEFNEKALPAEKVLQLKEGAQIMFIKNDKGEFRRYYNGRIATVSKIEEGKIFVRFPNEEKEMELEKETWKNIRYSYNKDTDSIDEETQGTFKQYPIRLAWAITIHKSQGLTFEKAIIDAGESFAPGQVYVALSRLTTLDGLILCSRILPQAIITDERVLAFSKTEMAEDHLEEELKQQQKVFISRSLMECYNWEKLVGLFREHLEGYEHRVMPGQREAIAWAEKIMQQLEAQQEVSVKFNRQLERLLVDAADNNHQQLQNRISAAAAHFSRAMEEVSASLSAHIGEMRIKQRTKKYVEELRGLDMLLKRKIKQLQYSVDLAKALANGMGAQALFSLIESQKKLPPSPLQIQPGPGKPKKGETRYISLQLFKEGNKIPDIAKMRNLAVGTIEGHLISFISSEEIRIEDILSKKKIENILKAIRQNPEYGSSQLKENLGDEYSYGDIRAVLVWKDLPEKK
ncbi:MAG: helix-turn-helix domain-containing protein [Bacteroidetes bacterium]|nr:helix-turn-helix domain-containing protein [Bacteroidota bacterium]MBS1972968.1 helix-turn-helix domain-containing protein [Bacteroidota bacterium]